MNDYISLRIDASPCSPDITDLIDDALSEIGFESFCPDETGVTAYIPAGDYSEQAVRDALADLPIPTSLSLKAETIEGRDWNAEWEKNYFQPIVVGNECVIHASFHQDYPRATYDIVIDPRMAFGTGHHSTTSLILRHLLGMNLKGKSVIDMGTGTGILAILCCMRGASPVSGIEIDPMAYENAVENAQLNNVKVNLICGDASALKDIEPADIFIANINRNIILADLRAYVAAMKPGAKIILSGFYTRDIPMIERAGKPLGLILLESRSDNDWAAIMLAKE